MVTDFSLTLFDEDSKAVLWLGAWYLLVAAGAIFIWYLLGVYLNRKGK